MVVVKEQSKLFAHRLVARLLVCGQDSLLEQIVLNTLRQFRPLSDNGRAERQCELVVRIRNHDSTSR